MSGTSHTDALTTPKPVLKDPYRGIESFRYSDESIFFARESEVQRLLRQVATYRAVLIFGDSGAGKTSLINAGLLPLAVADGFRPERLRLQPRRGQEIVVERISLTPDGKPPYIASCLVPRESGSSRAVLSLAEFQECLGQANRTATPLLVFDQFEELITLFEETPQGEAPGVAKDLKKEITRMLIQTIQDKTMRVKLLFSFREDYLAKVLDLFEQHPDLIDHYVRLTPPTVEALHDIIGGPFERFPGKFRREFPGTLTQALCDSFASRSGSGLVNLSEMQIVLLRLWQAENPEELFDTRGVQGLLEDALSADLEGFGQSKRYAAVALLGQMVTASGARNVVSADDLIIRVQSAEGISEKKLRQSLKALETQTRLVRSERRHDVVVYEITSEFLIPWIVRQKEERLTRTEVEQWLQEAASRVYTEHRSAFSLRRKQTRLSAIIAVLALAYGALIVFWHGKGFELYAAISALVAIYVTVFFLHSRFQMRARRHQRVAEKYSAMADRIAARLSVPGGLTKEEWEELKKELPETTVEAD
jgi:hypothetical protein